MSTKTLPREITSYDLLKTFAVITMIIDHLGMYFFPDDMWWRAVGRLSFPVWLFLIGYAQSRDISPKLLIGAGILVVSTFIAGEAVFAMNILVSIALVRLVLDPIMRFAQKGSEYLWGIAAATILLYVPTGMSFDYGSLGLVFAMLGYMVRNRENLKLGQTERSFMIFAGISYVVIQYFMFGFTHLQLALTAVGIAFVCQMLVRFESKTYPDLTRALPSPVGGLLRLCGRRTLEIYVLHLLVFKFAALALGLGDLGLFDWVWIKL